MRPDERALLVLGELTKEPEGLDLSVMDADEAYRQGHDCGVHGPNQTNCHFSLFACREWTTAWERGKTAGELAKKKSFMRKETKP